MLTASYEEKIIEIAGIKEKDIPNWQCALDMIGIWRYYRERFYVVMVGSKPWKRARTFGLLPSNEPLITDIIQDIKQQGYPEYVLKGLRVIYQRFFLRLKWEESEFLSAFKVAYDTLRFKV